MAITGPLYRFYKDLHARGVLPQGGSILEIGEANWYGDIHPAALGEESYVLLDHFHLAKLCYEDLFSPQNITSIDLDGTPDALKLDLNQPIDLGKRFHVVINNGTLEHVFNVPQVFQTMHDHCWCDCENLMIHDAPFTGWIDHGFYCFQPTLFWDIAKANDYDIVAAAIGHIGRQSLLYVTGREQIHELAKLGGLPENAELFIAFKKGLDDPFRFPMQGCYNGSLSKEAAVAWKELR